MDLPSSQVSGVTAIAFAALVLLGTAACSPDRSADGEAGTTTSHDSTTEASTTIDDTSESGMTETETDTDDGPDDTNSEGGSFYAGASDWGGGSEWCDVWFQDCPEGEKCVPYASTGGTWDANKCVPILDDGQPGEPCSYDGVFEATDSCDGTGICWNTTLINDELVGTCTPFCTGTPDEPVCSEGSACVISNEGSITLCVQSCDPLAQDCPDGLGCQWVAEQFVCVQSEDEPPNQPCDMIGDCPAGSACVNGELVPDCAGFACCTSFCSISEPNCMAPTSECVPYFDDPPAGYEDVGICGAP